MCRGDTVAITGREFDFLGERCLVELAALLFVAFLRVVAGFEL